MKDETTTNTGFMPPAGGHGPGAARLLLQSEHVAPGVHLPPYVQPPVRLDPKGYGRAKGSSRSELGD
jgi:hypothetical protein